MSRSRYAGIDTLQERSYEKYIIDGFEEDCETLIELFLDKQSLRLRDFLAAWKSTNFQFIFCGRPSFAELCEFSEEALRLASRYLFKTEDEYQTPIGGLYLVYFLYHTCGASKATLRIRMPPPAMRSLRALREFAVASQHYDVLYVLSSLLRDGVFKFVATTREYGLEISLQKYTSYRVDHSCDDKSNIDLSQRNLNFLADFKNEITGDIATTLEQYQKIKCQFPGGTNEMPPQELNYVNESFSNNVEKEFNLMVTSLQMIDGKMSQGQKNMRMTNRFISNKLKMKHKSTPSTHSRNHRSASHSSLADCINFEIKNDDFIS